MKFTCLACGSSEAAAWLSDCKDFYLDTPSLTTYVRCQNCDLVQQHPIPKSPEALYANYPVHSVKSRLYEWIRRRVFMGAYYTPPGPAEAMSVLDYGCGDGWYLDSLRGRAACRVGYEHDPGHAASLSERLGTPVVSDLSLARNQQPQGFQVVTLNFVMEHLSDPTRCLAQIRELLAPGGTVYILVPHIHSWEARLFKRKWHGLDAPRHIAFLDHSHIQRIAHDTGYEVREVRRIAFPNTLAASLATVCCGRFVDPIFKLFLLPSILLARLFPGGSMAYVLQGAGWTPSDPAHKLAQDTVDASTPSSGGTPTPPAADSGSRSSTTPFMLIFARSSTNVSPCNGSFSMPCTVCIRGLLAPPPPYPGLISHLFMPMAW